MITIHIYKINILPKLVLDILLRYSVHSQLCQAITSLLPLWMTTYTKKIKFVTQLILKILLIHWFEVLWARLSILYANYSKCLNKIITSVDIQPHSKNWFHTSTHSLNIEISEILQSDSLTIFSIIAQNKNFPGHEICTGKSRIKKLLILDCFLENQATKLKKKT